MADDMFDHEAMFGFQGNDLGLGGGGGGGGGPGLIDGGLQHIGGQVGHGAMDGVANWIGEHPLLTAGGLLAGGALIGGGIWGANRFLNWMFPPGGGNQGGQGQVPPPNPQMLQGLQGGNA